MESQELENLVRINQLKREAPDQSEFDSYVQRAKKNLKDAQNSAIELAIESRFTLAYEATYALALAALRWYGYRPNNNRHVVFDVLRHTLGVDSSALRKAHDRRNLMAYEGGSVEEGLTRMVIEEGVALLEKVNALGPLQATQS